MLSLWLSLLLSFFKTRAAKIVNVFNFEPYRQKQFIFTFFMLKLKTSFLTLFACTIFVFLLLDSKAQEPLHGAYKEFYPNGKVKTKGRYFYGKKTGNWYYYTEKKILEKRLLYRKGKLKRTYTYNLKGQLALIEDDKGNVHTKPACGCQ
jgi:hypothetical protein